MVIGVPGHLGHHVLFSVKVKVIGTKPGYVITLHLRMVANLAQVWTKELRNVTMGFAKVLV